MPNDQQPQTPSPTTAIAAGGGTRPPLNKLVARIRFLANVTSTVIIGNHAAERMEERGITSEDVYRTLRIGELRGEVDVADKAGEWKCKMVARLKGARQVGVVTIVLLSDQLFVKTVEWED